MKRYIITVEIQPVFRRNLWVRKNHVVEANSFQEARKLAREIYPKGKNITIKEKQDE